MATPPAQSRSEPNAAPRVFWSWQNDYSPKTCRTFIREALVTAIARLGEELGVDDADRPELDHDTKGERGMVDIAATILAKISRSAVFVADLTPVGRSASGKWLPNPNVMIELGWAMQKPGWERVIGVLNTAGGAEIEDLPFDIRQRRILTYVLTENADKATGASVHKKLVAELKGALQINLSQHSEQVASETPIVGVPANPNNPSIWATACDTLRHNDAFGHAGKQEIAIPDLPRAYMRVIPSGWKTHPPSIAEVARSDRDVVVEASSDSAMNGDFGATEEGYVRYWITGKTDAGQPSSVNMTMFFEHTGEFWSVQGSIITPHDGMSMLRDHAMLGHWSTTLRQAMSFMDRYGANGVRRVDAGLFGAQDLHWFSQWQSHRTPSRTKATLWTEQRRDWSADAQLTFLTHAYNTVRNLFALPRSTEAEVTAILMQFDRARFATSR